MTQIQTHPAPDPSKRSRLFIFTDSRGQHKPHGSTHKLFAERLAENPRFEVRSHMSPMKWTTTLDFLESFPAESLAEYDYVILYTGIVDWSPRKVSSALNDLYDNASAENAENFGLNTNDYSRKVVNSKKAIFDEVFGAEALAAHFARPFETVYDGEATINMYGLDAAVTKLVPQLAKISNLIFINSNRFVPGWEGDYTKGRPANIRITEDYSQAMRDALPTGRVIDLLQWDERAVTEFTCDNLHLTAAGSDWIHDEILARIASLEAIAAPMAPIALDRSGDLDALNAFVPRVGSPEAVAEYLDARRAKSRTLTSGLPSHHADQAYLDTMSFLLDDDTCEAVIAANADVKSDTELAILTGRLYASQDAAAAYVADRMAHYRRRWQAEYRLLTVCKLNIFPYNYFSAYSFRAMDRVTPPEPVSIDFIYCIKNRRQRTTISASSLIRSIRAYESTASSTLTARITVVEDVSPEVFDPNVLDAPTWVDHYILDTGVGWTRSGLLNVGIRNSSADLIALVDADFLFHEGYIKALAEFIALCDWKRLIVASNLIETEAHSKGETTYSALSPYSYMWFAPRAALHEVRGFDEGYTGHGSEDRDLELKLQKLCGLTVADTASLVPDCVVLHLSHNARDGSQQHQTNRKRYLERLAATDSKTLRQEKWGEQKAVWACRSIGSSSAHNRAVALHSPLAPRRHTTESLSFVANGDSRKRTLYMIISCAAYNERQRLLEGYYRENMPVGDGYLFIVGGATRNWFDATTHTLHLTVGDFYEDLPEKVLQAIAFVTKNFDFAHLVKVDDDVIVNFSLLTFLITTFRSDYFGKMIPSRRGAKPSPTWHIGKVSELSVYFGKPFSFEGGPPNWACGGMYAISLRAAHEISALSETAQASEYLYEDHMVGCLLAQQGIAPVFIEEHETLQTYKFIQTDLRELLDEKFEVILDSAFVDSVGGVHCGSFPPLYSLPKEKCLTLMEIFIRHYTENIIVSTKGSK